MPSGAIAHARSYRVERSSDDPAVAWSSAEVMFVGDPGVDQYVAVSPSPAASVDSPTASPALLMAITLTDDVDPSIAANGVA